ncbi:hypothetical protein CSOJ01_10131 [Colletotrichum sojae]|uniref:Uncharacterized protein n=1 Tax=Colletotrichum sojae TaxID=2175907 RepID=A0A8H6J188_9PEZI|nr:hypothetical protein CSOJ01_10131 [Colletotrichum sojae]
MKVDANLGFGPPSTLANPESLGRRRRAISESVGHPVAMWPDAVKTGLAVSGFEWLRWLLRRLRAKRPYRQDQSERSSSARRPASELPESRVDGVWTLKSGRTAKGGGIKELFSSRSALSRDLPASSTLCRSGITLDTTNEARLGAQKGARKGGPVATAAAVRVSCPLKMPRGPTNASKARPGTMSAAAGNAYSGRWVPLGAAAALFSMA